jgi:menaquinone-dependent protoporphyrinogen oxidase
MGLRTVENGQTQTDLADWPHEVSSIFWRDVMNVLIIYGTTEGQTRRIATWTATRIRRQGHQVELLDSAAPAADLKLGDFQAFIVAASVHHEHHQEAITNFVFSQCERLNARPSAFISVSLSAALEDEKPEAQKYADRFVSVTGWRPRATLLLGGALRLTEYDYFQEQVVKFIVMKRSGTAIPEHDQEFTDWNALADFVDRFLEPLGSPMIAVEPLVHGRTANSRATHH